MTKLICLICNKEFKVKPYRKTTAKYCSHKCYSRSKIGHIPWNKDIKYTLKMKTRLNMNGLRLGRGLFKGKTVWWNRGLKNPMKKEKIKEKVHSNPSVQVNYFKKGGISFNKGKSPSPETLRKMLTIRTPNKAELTLNQILKTKFPKEWKFVGNGKVIIEGKNPDFININGKKLIIDLFGEHWHELNEVKLRTNIFTKYGYKTLIIWDYELRKPEIVYQKVKELCE